MKNKCVKIKNYNLNRGKYLKNHNILFYVDFFDAYAWIVFTSWFLINIVAMLYSTKHITVAKDTDFR